MLINEKTRKLSIHVSSKIMTSDQKCQKINTANIIQRVHKYEVECTQLEGIVMVSIFTQ